MATQGYLQLIIQELYMHLHWEEIAQVTNHILQPTDLKASQTETCLKYALFSLSH